MIDAVSIRRRAYALAELESTIYCFFGGVMYLCTDGPCEDPNARVSRGAAGLDMISGAVEWERHMALVCDLQ